MYRKVLSLGMFLVKGYEVSLLMLVSLAHKELHISLFQVGILGMVFVVGQLASSFYSGYVAKRVGLVGAINLSFVLFGFAWLSCGISPHFYTYGVGCLLAGVGMGLFEPLAGAFVVQYAKAGSVGKEVANFGAFGDLGRISLSTIAASVFALWGLQVTLMAFFFLSVLMWIGIVLCSPKERVKTSSPKQESYLAELAVFGKNRRYVFSDVAGITDAIAGSSLYIFLPFLLADKGIDMAFVGWLVSPVYFSGLMAGRLFLGRLADKFSAVRILIVSEIVMAVLILLVLVVTGYVWIGISLFLLGMFARGTSPVLRLMIAESVSDKEDLPKAFGLYSFSTRLAIGIGRPFLGYLGTAFGIVGVFGGSAFFALATLLPAILVIKNPD